MTKVCEWCHRRQTECRLQRTQQQSYKYILVTDCAIVCTLYVPFTWGCLVASSVEMCP